MYLLDTNVCIDFALGRSDALRARMRTERSRGLAISTITLAELRVGTRRPDADPEDERRLELLVTVIGLYGFDGAAAETYGRLGREIGVKRKSFDRLIAAHAIALGLTLVTSNRDDFADVPGLSVENWTE